MRTCTSTEAEVNHPRLGKKISLNKLGILLNLPPGFELETNKDQSYYREIMLLFVLA